MQKYNNKKLKMSIAQAFESGEQKQNKAHLENLIAVALTDGVIVDSEKQLLVKYARRMSISDVVFEEMLKGSHNYAMNPPMDKEDRYKRFFHLIEVMLSDNIEGEKQDRLIHSYAIGLGYSEDQTEELYEKTIRFVKDKVDFQDAFKLI